MKSTTLAVVSVLLSAGALAVPTVGHKHAAAHHARLHHKRAEDVVWVTEFEVETVTVIETVYGDGRPVSRSTATNTAVTTTPAANPVTPSTTASTSSSAATENAYRSQAPATTLSLSTTSSTAAPTPAPTTTSSSSSVHVSPETTAAVVTTSASAYVAPISAAPSSFAAATSAAATGYSGGGSTLAGATYTGEFTHWDPALGACGVTNTAGEAVVAISQTLFDPSTPNGNPNNNPLCGRKLSLVGKDGSSYTATVVDRCVSCAQGDLDLTLSLFNTVTSNGDGRVANMKWSWT